MRYKIFAVMLVALIVVTTAPVSGATVKTSTYSTGSEFNAGTLNGLSIDGDSVAHSYGDTSVTSIQDGGSWSIHGDPGGDFNTGSPATYSPGGKALDHWVQYDGQSFSPNHGTTHITAEIELYEDDNIASDKSNDINGGIVLAEESSGVAYGMVMRSSDYSDPWKLVQIKEGGSVNYISNGFGGHVEFGGSIDVELKYNHGTNTLTGIVNGPSTVSGSRSVNAGIHPTRAGITATADEYDFMEVHDMDVTGSENTGGTYTSQAHDIDAPTEAQVDLQVNGGTADVSVVDGNGNTLGSGTYTSGGTKTIFLSPSAQVGSEAYVNIDVSSADSDVLKFHHYKEQLYADNRAPSVTTVTPDGGTYDSASVQLEADVSDPDLGTNGDSVNVEWYVDGTKVHTTTGVTTDGTVTYQTADRDDGDYQWHAKVVDSQGATDSGSVKYFTIEHGPTTMNNVEPAATAVSEYETNTFSVDVSDPDFADQGGGGDNVDVRFYVDGQLKHEETISSTQTVSTDIGPLGDGDHDWYIETEDKYGYVNQLSTRTLIIDHNVPVLSGGSPTGTVEYEDQTLSVDVSDDDFAKDGDSVDVTFYVDGSKVVTRTLSSDGTASVDVGPLDDGQHTWSAEASDQYGLTGSTGDQTFTVEHHDPVLSNPGPTGTFDDSEPTMTVDVSDEDFAKDGDSVVVGFYIDGSKVGEDTVTQDASTAQLQVGPLADGTYNAHMKATDQYGRTDATNTFSFTVEHNDPQLSNAGLTGVTHYEENTLSVDLADSDFTGEGDSVTLEFILDGQVVSTQTADSAGTYKHTVGPLDDGSYTWRVDAVDSYDRTGTTGSLSLDVQHDDPAVSSPSPDGTVNYEANTLEVFVEDSDFGRDGDTVDVKFYVDGTVEATKTVSTSGTVSANVGPYEDGTYTWHVEAVDDYGYTTTTANWTLDIQHAAPFVSSMDDPGTTNRENVDLTVNIQDDDFIRDGDIVSVTWYVDGTELTTKEVSLAGDVTATTDQLGEGTHSWNVDLADDYGYTASSNVQQFEVEHHPPVVDDSSMKPTEGTTLTNYSTTFSVNVTDVDFADPTANENVTAELYVEDELQNSTYVTSNGTATVEVVPGYGGEVTYHWEFTDKYGLHARSQDVNITSPGSLELYKEQDPSQQVSTTGDVAFYFQYEDKDDKVVTRPISSGSVDMGGLATDESFVAVARADGYYNRRVWVPSLFESDRMYLIADDADVVQQSFQLKDYTGDFPLDQTVLEIERNIQGEWTTVDGDYFGADDQLNSILEYNARHRLILRNTETGQSRELGTLFPVAGGIVELRIFDDRQEVYQGNVPHVTYEPDVDRLPASNGTVVGAAIDPRESGVTEYTAVATLGGVEVHNQTYSYDEDVNMTYNLNEHNGDELTVNVSYQLNGQTAYSQRTWPVGDNFSGRGEGLVSAAATFFDQLGSDLAGLVAVLVSGLVVAFTSNRVGPRTSGTISMMALTGFTLLGFITTGWLAVAATAYLTLLGARWYA